MVFNSARWSAGVRENQTMNCLKFNPSVPFFLPFFLLAAAIAFTSIPALAEGEVNVQVETPAARPKFYLGIDAARMSQKNTDDSGNAISITGTAKTTNVRLKGGIHALKWLDAEMHIIFSTTGEYDDSAGGNVSFSTSVIGFFAKPNFDLGPVNIYGLFGFSGVSSDLSSATIWGTSDQTGFSAGAGLQFSVVKDFWISADYVLYQKDINYGAGQNDTITAVGIGANYSF
jgi:opacity protein-like surface antigen